MPLLSVGPLHHVGIVVPSLESAVSFWRDTLGLAAGPVHELPANGVRVQFVEGGQTSIELLEPIDPASGVGRFLAERGRSTLHHVCFAVADLDVALAELRGRGYRLVDEAPRRGAEGLVAFLHPSAADGVLVELIVPDDVSPDAGVPRSKPPRVAVTFGAARQASDAHYLDAVREGGAEPVELRPGERVPEFDALCLTGGADVHPRFYGEPVNGAVDMDEERDRFELDLLRRALDADVPVLGVCRGHQLLNVGFGSSLVQDITGHRKSVPPNMHSVVIEPGSKLASAIGAGAHDVNSRHHQAVSPQRLAPGLRATAAVGDVVEAFESRTHRFVIGVQWHPERAGEVSPGARRIFAALAGAAATRKRSGSR